MEQGGSEGRHGSAWGNMGRLPGWGGLQAEPQPVVLGSRALGQRPKTAHQRPPKARPPPTGWQPPEWTARAQSGWHVRGGPGCVPDVASFSPLFPQQTGAPTPHGPTPPQGQHYDPRPGPHQACPDPGQDEPQALESGSLGHTSCVTMSPSPPFCGPGFAQGTGASLSTFLQGPGRARLHLCPSTCTPASAHRAQRRGPGSPGPAGRRQTMAGPSVIARSEAACKNGSWGSGPLELQQSFHLQQSWAPPLANCTPTFCEVWGGHSTQGTEGEPWPSLPSGQTAAT